MAKLRALGLLLLATTAVVALGSSQVAGAGNGTLSVSPSSQNVMSGIADYGGVPGKGHPGVFNITIHQNADVVTVGTQTNIGFDATKLQVDSISKGAAYATAQTIIAGVAPQTLQDAITEANTTGLLKNVAVAYADQSFGSVPTGDAEAIVVTMETLPLATGSSAITLTGGEVIDTTGDTVTLGSPTNGSVNISVSPDRDGDGCTDVKEQQVAAGSETTGGLRDFANPYDYFNPTHDGKVRVDDILLVVNAYFIDDTDGNPGLPPYTAGYTPGTDRFVPGGAPHPWSLQRGNGQQRVDDILNIVKQYFHDCA